MIRLIAAAAVGAGWCIHFGFLIWSTVAGNELRYSALRATAVQVLVVATVAVAVAIIVRRGGGRPEPARVGAAEIARAVELGRELERVRDEQPREGVVLPFRGPDPGGRPHLLPTQYGQ